MRVRLHGRYLSDGMGRTGQWSHPTTNQQTIDFFADSSRKRRLLSSLLGERCRSFLDDRMKDLELTHLQFDEQWTFVGKKQSRLTVDEKDTCHDLGDMYQPR